MVDNALTLRDYAARLDPKGEKFNADIINLIYQNNPLLTDMPVVEANDGTSNFTTFKIALPEAQWVGLREGVKTSKGGVTSVRNTAAHLSTMIEMSQREYDRAPDKNAFIADQVADHIEGMNQKANRAVVYGSTADNPREINGFFMHMKECGFDLKGAISGAYDVKKPEFYICNGGGALSAPTGATRDNIGQYSDITVQNDAATMAALSLRSIGLVGLGSRTINMFYPQGTKAGIVKGEWKEHQTLIDDNGGKYEGCQQFLDWDLGLNVRDWRYMTWMRNIDIASLEKRGFESWYKTALRRMKTRVGEGKCDGCKLQWVMSCEVWEGVQTIFERLTMSNACGFEQLEGIKTETLWGIPVRTLDVMNVDEEPLKVKAA
jgi:hypothetical protein